MQSIMANNQGVLDATHAKEWMDSNIQKLSGTTQYEAGTWGGNSSSSYGYTSSGWLPHQKIIINIGPYSCPTPTPSSNTSTNPAIIYNYNSSNNAVIVAWLNSGSVYCVSI